MTIGFTVGFEAGNTFGDTAQSAEAADGFTKTRAFGQFHAARVQVNWLFLAMADGLHLYSLLLPLHDYLPNSILVKHCSRTLRSQTQWRIEIGRSPELRPGNGGITYPATAIEEGLRR